MYNEYGEKTKVLHEKENIIFDEKNELDKEMGVLAEKAGQISLGIKTLVDKAKSMLDNPKLLSQEKLELKELISKKESLDNKANQVVGKLEALENKINTLIKNYNESIAKPIDIINKSSAEMETYQYKIEYDNVSFQAWLKEYEKQVEVAPQIARKKELYVAELEKTFEEYVKSATEVEKFFKEFMENKSLVRKYEKLFKKIEKGLAKLGA